MWIHSRHLLTQISPNYVYLSVHILNGIFTRCCAVRVIVPRTVAVSRLESRSGDPLSVPRRFFVGSSGGR
jgi:hypothetical protein